MASLTRFASALLLALALHTGQGSNAKPPGCSNVDVVIVGAGQAGMAAALRLAEAGKKVHVIEATDHVGGRTRNLDVVTSKTDIISDDVMELGGTWLSPYHVHALGMVKHLGLEVYNFSGVGPKQRLASLKPRESWEWPWWFWGDAGPADQEPLWEGKTVFHKFDGTVATFFTPEELLSHISPAVVAELKIAGEQLQNLTTMISCQGPKQGDRRTNYIADSYTFEAWSQQELKLAESRLIIRNFMKGIYAQEPQEVSLLAVLQTLKLCCSGGADDQYRVRGGTQALPLKAAEAIKRLGGVVTLNSPVYKVITHEDRSIEVRTESFSVCSAAVVLTGAPPALLQIRFVPSLPTAQAQLLQRMPMGTSQKFSAVYPTAWWRKRGFHGGIVALGTNGLKTAEGWPLFVDCVDHSPFSQGRGVLGCFVEGVANLEFRALDAEARKAALVDFLGRSFGDVEAARSYEQIVDFNWADQEYARGAYAAFFSPGAMTQGPLWEAFSAQEKVPGVFVAGSDYTVRGNGYIEGAILSGESAAKKVLEALGRGARPEPIRV